MKRFALAIGVLLAGALMFLFVRLAGAPLLPAATPVVSNPTPAASPSPTPVPATPTPAPQLEVQAQIDGDQLRFQLSGSVPAGADEALFWFDADAGASPRRVPLNGSTIISTSVTISASEGLTVTVPRDLDQLDYWWAVRSAGDVTLQSGTLLLPPELHKRSLAPSVPPGFEWQEQRSEHFLFRFPPDSPAARDIAEIERIAEEGYLQASAIISPSLVAEPPTEPATITVYLVPRVFWQGGVAYGRTLMISYLDRNYTDVVPWSYFVHETVHALSRAYAAQGVDIGALLGEGIAVYATGGHYDSEPLLERAAALQQLGRAQDLCELNLRFYELQHEAAYLQGASYAAFLIERYGLAAFLNHYLQGRMPLPGQNEDAEDYCQRLYGAVAEPFGSTYGELEAGWLEWVGALSVSPTATTELSTTLRFYDRMREYETVLDPPARLIPSDPSRGWSEETLAKFLTSALTPTNVLHEVVLIDAHRSLLAGDLQRAAALLDEIERSLEGGELAGPLASEYAAVQALFAELARARRLGQEIAPGALSLPDALEAAPPSGLYGRFEIALQQLQLSGSRGEGLVVIDAQPVDGEQSQELYRFVVERRQSGWLLSLLEPAVVILESPPGAEVIVGQ